MRILPVVFIYFVIMIILVLHIAQCLVKYDFGF